MSRVRLSVLATQLGVNFPNLFTKLCHTLPQAVDDHLTVSETFAAWLRQEHARAARR